MNKDRHILSELNSFFAESNNTKAIQGIINVMSHITHNQRQMDFAKSIMGYKSLTQKQLDARYGKRGKYVEESGL